MKLRTFCALTSLVFSLVTGVTAGASQAEDTTISVNGHVAGPTPFISQVTLHASETDVLAKFQFTVAPKPGATARPLSGTYSAAYLIARGQLDPATGDIFLPVYGLYAGFTNTVTLKYYFTDGSSKEDTLSIATAGFSDDCGYGAPMILAGRDQNAFLSYDYMLVKGSCSEFSPEVVDTDHAVRWVGDAGIASYNSTFFDNAFYVADSGALTRIDLDGTVTQLPGYAALGVTDIHHNIDPGKVGMLLEVDTTQYFESVIMEVDTSGAVLKTWNMADIISAAMIAGGDDPSQFVYMNSTDWFHNNAVAYNRADDSLIVSSRENFLIALDYETGAIKWILGDPTKKWHQFPSLQQYALTLTGESQPPIGQHAVSVTYDQGVLVFDNGQNSIFQMPPGVQRGFASPRKYQLDLEKRTATEVWNYPQDASVYSPFCGSAYEDAPLNYLVDYAFVNGGVTGKTPYAQLLGIDPADDKAFYYQYPTTGCNTAFNSLPIHLEHTVFPTVGPQSLNISTRGQVGVGENALIAGFIITGNDPKSVVLRALGPSLGGAGLTGILPDPAITLYDASGNVVATNDNWQSGPDAAAIAGQGLAPADPAEAALKVALSPGSYTAVATGVSDATGLGLAELYDVSPTSDSRLGNISTRGLVGTGDSVLISGFIVGDIGSSTVILRALGPTLSNAGINNPVADPNLTVFDQNGSAVATNDNWQDNLHALEIEQNKLAPSDDAEAALILKLMPGAYTAIAAGAAGSTGVGLIEIYNLE